MDEAQNRIDIVIVDDSDLFRTAVVDVLKDEPDFMVVGQGATADDAVRLAHQWRPDILILDLHMPGGGLNSARVVARDIPAIKIVVLTTSENVDDVLDAIHIGVCGYIVKGVSSRDLIDILHGVAVGKCYISPITPSFI